MVPIPLLACFTLHLRTGLSGCHFRETMSHNWRKAALPMMSNEPGWRVQTDCSLHSTPTYTHSPSWEDSCLSLIIPESWRHTETVTHGAEKMVLRIFTNSLTGSSEILGTHALKEQKSCWKWFLKQRILCMLNRELFDCVLLLKCLWAEWSHEPLLWVSPASSASGKSAPETLFAKKAPNLLLSPFWPWGREYILQLTAKQGFIWLKFTLQKLAAYREVSRMGTEDRVMAPWPRLLSR